MISLPSRSGRIFLSSSSALSSRDALLQAVLGPGQPAPPWPCSGSCSRPGSARAAWSAAGPRPARSGAPRQSVHSPGPYPWNRRCSATSVDTSATTAAGKRSAGSRDRAIGRAHRLVVVERHPAVGQQGPGLRLADVVQQRGQPQHSGPVPARTGAPGRWPAPARSASAGTRPCAGCARRSPAGAWAPRAAPRRPRRCPPAARCRAAGRCRGPASAWSARRGSARPTRSPSRRRQLGHGRGYLGRDGEAQLRGEPGRPHDPQRVVGERVRRAARGAQHLVPQVARPPNGSTSSMRRQPRGHRVDREVTAAQVLLERRAVPGDWLARLGPVGLAPVGGDLEDGAAPCAARRCRTRSRSSTPGRPSPGRSPAPAPAARRWPGPGRCARGAETRPRTVPPTRTSSCPCRANTRPSSRAGAAGARSSAAAASRCCGPIGGVSGTGIEGRG